MLQLRLTGREETARIWVSCFRDRSETARPFLLFDQLRNIGNDGFMRSNAAKTKKINPRDNGKGLNELTTSLLIWQLGGNLPLSNTQFGIELPSLEMYTRQGIQ
jgi:hypothetical protein